MVALVRKAVAGLLVAGLAVYLLTGSGTDGMRLLGHLGKRIFYETSQERLAVQQSDMVMDTVAQLTATGPEAQAAVDESFARLHELEGLLSPGAAGSDSQRLAQSAGSGEWVPVSPEMYHLLSLSQRISALSGGAWDVTMGPLTGLWGIGTEHGRVPSEGEIAAAKGLVNWRWLELDEDSQSARLLQPGMSLDVGGIAKGLAVDEVRRIYAAHDIQSGLINLGSSSLYAVGASEGSRPWRIGIRHPRSEDTQQPLAVLRLSGEALSTSGDYEHFFEQEGVRYHHILDVRTGRPAGLELPPEQRAMSVTAVVAGANPDAGLLADVLTTTAFVLGPREGRDFLQGLAGEKGFEGIEGEVTGQDGLLWVTPGLRERLRRLADGFRLDELSQVEP